MPPTSLEIVVADGHRFSVRRFAAGSARPGLLFLPALGVPAQKYDAFAACLAAGGIDVAIPDWRGLGSSSLRAGRGSDWNYADLLRDMEAVSDALGATPRVFGGHSLGGQFATMLAARRPARTAGLALIGSGVPFPPAFATDKAWALRVFAWTLPAAVAAIGHFPGRRLRFAGREAAGVMRDWAATARRGTYADYGDGEPMEAMLRRVDVPVFAVAMEDDWLAPTASLRMLLDKLGGDRRHVATLDAGSLGVAADHFAWMRRPEAVVARLAAGWPNLSS